MKLPQSERFVDEDGESFLFTKVSGASGQVGALYVPAGNLTLTTERPTISNTLPLGFKCYDNATVSFDQDRINALRELPRDPHTTSILALPIELGRRHKGRDPCGFFMPLFEKHKGLDACFPYENYIDLCDHKRSDGPFIVAANLAFAVHHAYTRGLTIGDFNPKNFMVDPKTGLVRVIDVDGMQFFAASGKTYLTDVIQPEYPTPYLRGKKPLPIEHDHFGLAMLIFRILNLGAHPFYLKRSSGRDTSPDHNIKNRLYGYAPEIAKREKFVITDDLLRPSEYSGTLARMFTQAFTSEKPPTALKWHKELSKFVGALKPCGSVKGHMHPPGLPCYLCAFERRSKKRKALYRGLVRPPTPFKLATEENIVINIQKAITSASSKPVSLSKEPAVSTHTPAHSSSPSRAQISRSNVSKPKTPTAITPPVAPRPPPPKSQNPLTFIVGGLAILLVVAWFAGGFSFNSSHSTPNSRPSSKPVTVTQPSLPKRSYRATGVAWYADNQVHPSSRNPIWRQTRELMKANCVRTFMHIDFISFHPGNSPLTVTRRRVEALDASLRRMAGEHRVKRYTSSISYAHTSRHPKSQAPNPTVARGRSIQVTVSCRPT